MSLGISEWIEGHERLYYQYQRSRASICTTQIHGMAHLATATKKLGPLANFHQYTGEREILETKNDVHSGSAPNENLSNNIAEKERMKIIPYVIKNIDQSFTCLGVSKDEQFIKLHGVAMSQKYGSTEYNNHIFKHPHRERHIGDEEKSRLQSFHQGVIGRPLNNLELDVLDKPFRIWARCVNGYSIHNTSRLLLLGSIYSLQSLGGDYQGKNRDNSYVRYSFASGSEMSSSATSHTFEGLRSESSAESNTPHTSYFGRIHYYIPYTIRIEAEGSQDEYEFLLAFMEHIPTGYVTDRAFAYEIPSTGKKKVYEFVDVRNIKEVVGAITTRGRSFWIHQISCFWPKTDYGYDEYTKSNDVYLKGRGLRKHRQPGNTSTPLESEEDEEEEELEELEERGEREERQEDNEDKDYGEDEDDE